ncbi:hypothetical protein JRO89_XS04G0043800 [Xanthoceras sorbifolium]|uniref:SWIM-type domain-containing protein n=1 Tax=Xanthoceras sorbifolium TaxID=99658 RepID=A0ABQ8I4Q4_9ROSI|nr:hypothetical protein JRO89_XS04G0043800 [Xanthoceras sorbifolium]
MADHALIVPDASLSLEERTLAIGQEFPDVETCRRTLKDIAISLHFDLRIVKSDRSRFIAKCSKEGCPWRVHVAKCPGVPTFSIRTLHGEHTCEGVRNLHHQQASVGWVARSVEARIRDNPQYKPKEILQDIRDQHGVAVSYMQAWRGKERSMAALHGTFEEGYRLLPAYCEQIRKTNPGSIASVVATGSENCFQRLFISYRASIYGFINASIDADNALFPLAIGIVDVESDENWMWFMSELRKLLGVNTENMPRLTILSERQRDGGDLTRCDTVVSTIPSQLWAIAYFEGVRYGHFTLGVTELLYNWALECHELPIVQMILEAIADARCYQVLRANEVEFEIVSTERTNIVDIRSRICSCRRWQLYGLPCAHAAAALISCGQNVHLFAEPCFTVASYRETYSQMINPIPDKNRWKEPGEGAEGGGAKLDMTIRPPKTRRPPGRPKKKVLRVETLSAQRELSNSQHGISVSCSICENGGFQKRVNILWLKGTDKRFRAHEPKLRRLTVVNVTVTARSRPCFDWQL